MARKPSRLYFDSFQIILSGYPNRGQTQDRNLTPGNFIHSPENSKLFLMMDLEIAPLFSTFDRPNIVTSAMDLFLNSNIN